MYSCETDLPDPGAGFVDHLDDSADCSRGFESWKGNVAGDMRAGWGG